MNKLLISLFIVGYLSIQVLSHGGPSYPPSRQWRIGGSPQPSAGHSWNCGGFQSHEQIDEEICKSLMSQGNINHPITCWSCVGIGSAEARINGEHTKANVQAALKKHQNAVGNGPICSGGMDSFSVLDSVTWQQEKYAVPLDLNRQWAYAASAPHVTYPTGYLIHYITKDGWDKSKPLTWDQLELDEPFCDYVPENTETALQRKGILNDQGDQQIGLYSCGVPKNKSGYHVIYNIWQRADSGEAFYGCSDVLISNDGSDNGSKPDVDPVDDPQDPVKTDPFYENSMNEEGTTFEVTGNPSVGDSLDFSVYQGGNQVISVQFDITDVSGWKATLAQRVNSQGQGFQLGLENANRDGIVIQDNNEVHAWQRVGQSYRWSLGFIENPENGGDEPVDNGDDEPVDNGDDEPVDNGDDEPVDNGDDEPVDNSDQPWYDGCKDQQLHAAWSESGYTCQKDGKPGATFCLYAQPKAQCCGCGGGDQI